MDTPRSVLSALCIAFIVLACCGGAQCVVAQSARAPIPPKFVTAGVLARQQRTISKLQRAVSDLCSIVGYEGQLNGNCEDHEADELLEEEESQWEEGSVGIPVAPTLGIPPAPPAPVNGIPPAPHMIARKFSPVKDVWSLHHNSTLESMLSPGEIPEKDLELFHEKDKNALRALFSALSKSRVSWDWPMWWIFYDNKNRRRTISPSKPLVCKSRLAACKKYRGKWKVTSLKLTCFTKSQLKTLFPGDVEAGHMKLPVELRHFDHLRMLKIIDCPLMPGWFPSDSFRHIPRLERVNLQGTAVNELPNIANTNVSKLELVATKHGAGSRLRVIPGLSSSTLRDLKLSYGIVEEVDLGHNQALRRLILIGQPRLKFVEVNFEHVPNIRWVDFRRSGMKRVAFKFGDQKGTKGELLYRLRIDTLRSLVEIDVTGEAALESLKLYHKISRNSKLGTLPEALYLAPILEKLDISHNALQTLSPRIAVMRNLKEADLSNNALTELPESMAQLKMLDYLLLHNNKLTSLPRRLDPRRLKVLTLYGNILPEIEKERNAYVRNAMKLAEFVKSIRDFSVKYNTNYAEIHHEFFNPCGSGHKALRWAEEVSGDTTIECNVYNYPEKVEISGFVATPKAVDAIAALTTTRSLKIRESFKMAVLPVSWTSMRYIMAISIRESSITEVDGRFFQLKYLNRFELTDCGISRIDFENATSPIQSLSLSSNALSEPPKNIHSLHMLRTLDMRNNLLKELPVGIFSMSSLRSLRFSRNLVSSVDSSFSNSKLRNLVADKNSLTEIPPYPHTLEHLQLSSNLLRVYPRRNPYGKKVTLLKTMDVSGNDLTELPADWLLESMFRFDISKNKITYIPEPPARAGVRSLNFSHNRIKSLPRVTLFNSRTVSLDISHNELEEIPREFFPSGSNNVIAEVLLSYNKLRTFDMNLGDGMLKHLVKLDLSHNEIEAMDNALLRDLLSQDPGTRNNLELMLNFNHLVGHFRNNGEQPTLHHKQKLYIDDYALPSTSEEEVVATIMGNAASGRSLSWKESGQVFLVGKKECTTKFVRIRHMTLIASSCQCANGSYRSSPHSCKVCIANASCHGGDIHCNEGFYRDWSDKENPMCVSCHNLMEKAKCFDNHVVPNPGYWSPQNVTSSVFACKTPGVCFGGRNSTVNCAEGHSGILCSECDAGMFKNSKGHCEVCPDRTMSIFTAILLGIIGATALIALTCLGDMKVRSLVPRKAESALPVSGAQPQMKVVDGEQSSTAISQMMKMAVSFMQTICAASMSYEVDWDDVILKLKAAFAWVNLEFLYPSALECLWEHHSAPVANEFAKRWTFYESFLLQSTLPLIAIGICVLCLFTAFVVRLVLRPEKGISMEILLVFFGRMLLLIGLLAYLPVSAAAFQYFKCTTFDGGSTYHMDSDYSVLCYDSNWYAYLPVAVATIVIYAIGMPVTILVMLAPPSLFPEVSKRYEWYMKGSRIIARAFQVYKTKYKWWESVELVRQLLITSVVIHLGGEGTFQLSIAITISFFAVVCHMYAKPFILPFLNYMQGVQLVLIYLTLSCGLLKSIGVPDGMGPQMTTAIVIFDVVVVSVVVIRILSLLGFYVGKFIQKQVVKRHFL